jgi:hypothetical protein
VGWNSYDWYIPTELRRPEAQRKEMTANWFL